MKNTHGIALKALVIIVIAILIFLGVIIDSSEEIKEKLPNKRIINSYSNKTFSIISSQENEPLEDIVKNYANKKGYDVSFEYAGTLDILAKLNEGESYAGVWLSNSIWGYMLDSSVKLSNSKCTSINPVIFAIKKDKAETLGFIGKTVYTKDIVNAISEGKLKFSMSNPTSTNSGASAYLGMIATLAGNPEVLTEENLKDTKLQENIKTLFSGMERSSGDEDFLEELFLNGSYEAVVTYESSIININRQLVAKGETPLYAIYPVDGVSISDSPFAYIDNKNDSKKEIFEDLQSYILSNDGQKLLQEKGKRTWYGGISENVDKTIFNPDWGINTSQYISPIKYPSVAVIKKALNLYQEQLRKPVHVAFCLDYSGSMSGEGISQLKNAMQYILTEEASNDFIQFSEKDKIDVIPFNAYVKEVWSSSNGTDTDDLLYRINKHSPNGSTAIYAAANKAIELLKNEDTNTYNLSIVLMTDGEGNVGIFEDLKSYYRSVGLDIPIYSIMFGEASESQLKQIANLTNAKVFDGRKDLVKAFKEVRGYN